MRFVDSAHGAAATSAARGGGGGSLLSDWQDADIAELEETATALARIGHRWHVISRSVNPRPALIDHSRTAQTTQTIVAGTERDARQRNVRACGRASAMCPAISLSY
jgi:hypothetical protein